MGLEKLKLPIFLTEYFSVRHRTFVEHKSAIHLINECCTCGKVDVDSKSLNYKTLVSSPLPIGTPMLPEPVPLQVVPHFQVLEELWCLLLVRLTISQLRCDCSQKRYLSGPLLPRHYWSWSCNWLTLNKVLSGSRSYNHKGRVNTDVWVPSLKCISCWIDVHKLMWSRLET